MKMRLAVSAVVLAVGVAACSDHPSPTSAPAAPGTGSPLFAISDGAHSGGNPDFFFLPPLVGNPVNDPNFDRGKFNPGLRPVVLVFPLPGGDKVCTGTQVFGPAPAPASAGDEQYHLNWNTKASNLVPGTDYRVCVFSSNAGRLLGFLDVEPISGGMKNARTGETYAFQDDRTLPIKFRIEFGALCADHVDRADCTEFPAVTTTGGNLVLTSGAAVPVAAVAVPPNAIGPKDTVTIVIEKQAPLYSEGTACLPTGLLQSKGCYHFSTDPPLYQFNPDVGVRMEVCVDVQYLDQGQRDALRLFKYNTAQGLVQLPQTTAPLVGDCARAFALAEPAASAPTSFAGAALRGLGRWAGRLFAPPPLYAAMFGGVVPKGVGGTGGSFSDVGGAVPVPTKLAFTVQPTNDSAGTIINPAVVVTLQDSLGNTVPTAADTVTVIMGTNPAGGTLFGTTAIAAVNGVATFPNLTIDKVGSGYTLIATSGTLKHDTSSTFSVMAGLAARLAFSVQPSNAGTYSAIVPAPQVLVQDTLGNTVTSSTVSITLAIENNPTGDTLTGTKVRSAVAGVATFDNISLGMVGAGYTLEATSSGLTSATSAAFNIVSAVPLLLAPAQDSYVKQYLHAPFCTSLPPGADYGFRLSFQWVEVPGAVSYEVYVIGPVPPTLYPLVDNSPASGSSLDLSYCGSYVSSDNAIGWTWHVTAILGDGSRARSATGRFNFTPPFQP